MTTTEAGVGEQVIRHQVLLTVDYDPARWRTEHGDEDVDYARVVEDVGYAWGMTDIAKAVSACTSSISECAVVSEDPSVRPRDRQDEAGFRRGVPRWVGGLEVLAVLGFKPGSTEQGFYASAVALTHAQHGVQVWSTHILYHYDDRPEVDWLLNAGDYTSDESRARSDLIERARARTR